MTWAEMLAEYSGSLMAAGGFGFGIGYLFQFFKKLADLI